MKDKIFTAFIHVAAFGVALLLVLAGLSLWDAYRFQKASNNNILSVQRDQIEQTCKQLYPCPDLDCPAEEDK